LTTGASEEVSQPYNTTGRHKIVVLNTVIFMFLDIGREDKKFLTAFGGKL
jgi:hypothetical protein